MHDFLLEEKAKKFMSGETITTDLSSMTQQSPVDNKKMTKLRIFGMTKIITS